MSHNSNDKMYLPDHLFKTKIRQSLEFFHTFSFNLKSGENFMKIFRHVAEKRRLGIGVTGSVFHFRRK